MKKLPNSLCVLLVFLASLTVVLAERAAGPAFRARTAELSTDQSNYAPGSTAAIAGSYFSPNETVTLQVVRVDGTPADGAAHQPWTVQADAQGDFVSEWRVCEQDCIGTELELAALGQQSGLVAVTVFNDGKQQVMALDQPGDNSNSQLQGWFNLAQKWGGTIQGSNSKYSEDNSIPLRFTACLKPGSKHTLLLKYDFSRGGTARFFDSLDSFDATESSANPLAGITSAGLPAQWSIPADSTLPAGAQPAGVLTTYNINSLSFGSYKLVNGVKVLPVYFVVGPGRSTANVVFACGGHLASASTWGPNNGAASFPGASAKAYASLDDCSDLNVSVNPGAVATGADLALAKTASPEPVFFGGNLLYQLIVTNCGPGAASAVVVTDALPAGLTLISASASQGSMSSFSPLSFNLGSLSAKATATISILTKVLLSTDGVLSNAATVSSATFDPVWTNNTAYVLSTVVDRTPPVIKCPADIVTGTDPGRCDAIVNFSASATDDEPNPTLSYNPPSGSVFSKGTTTVICTAKDADGNSASCSFNVLVQDTELPQITCPPDILVDADPDACSAVVNFEVKVSDNCPGATVLCTPPSGSSFGVGTTEVKCVATDAAGNTRSCGFQVTVRDTQPPRIVCPGTVITQAAAGRCDAGVVFTVLSALDNCDGVVPVLCNPASGSTFPIGTNEVVCTSTDSSGNTANCSFLVIVQDPSNQSWPQALPLTLVDSLGVQQADVEQCLTSLDQSRWFKFKVQPGSRVVATLTDLPENYDLVLFKDVAGAYSQLASPDDLVHVSAEFAADAFGPSAFSPDAFSPSAFSPSAFSPSAFSPSAFSPSAFSPSAFSPSAFSPSAFSPDAFAPSAFSPSAFSPSAFSPSAFSPSAFSPSAFSPSAFSAAQIQSVIAVSAFDGVASEGVVANTWDNNGEFYVRVRGRNGVFSPGNPFRLTVYQFPGACASVTPLPVDGQGQSLPPSTVSAPAGGYKTLILTDLNRWLGPGDSLDKVNVTSKLSTFALRPDVGGVVVDVGADAWVAFFNAQADANFDCPYAKNLVAGAIQAIVNRSRAGNALQYVVIVGDDGVIPFFRYPDEALLGPERNYIPPVKDLTASQASLRLDYVLGQDAYGAQCNFSLKTSQLPLPDLAVGRLVQTPAEVMLMLDAYLSTTGGLASVPASSLVTGYDFLADDAQAVADEFTLGIGAPPDTLISPNTLAPSLCWTADNLRQALFGKRHDLIFLAGHFSAGDALAADYLTHLAASELSSSTIDFRNTLIFSAGCHSGYNVVAADGIPFVTPAPDWARACALKQATLVAGTGYQYGDTDFIEYSERLYLEFAQQLRTGNGPVSVGQALLRAKQVYLSVTPEMRGIHTKTYLEAALFGLPMLSVDMHGTRRTENLLAPAVSQPQPVQTNPGAFLGLTFADLSVIANLTPTTITLNNTENGTQTGATYLSGADGLINNPAEPILPLELRNATIPGTVLRGVGFRGGVYTDIPGIVPLTGAAATEIRGVHATFLSEVFYPMRPWNINYFGALCGGLDGVTRLMAIPAQFRSDSPTSSTGNLRQYGEMDFRLFYDANITTYTDGSGNASTPALAAPPSISAVLGVASGGGGNVALSARVVGNPAAGIQGVWATFTAANGPYAGKWQSIDLAQSGTDSTLWQGSLTLNGTAAGDIRYMVQAVNGVGVVALDTKYGAYHIPDEFDSGTTAQLTPTTVEFVTAPASGAFSTSASFSARLSASGGAVLAGQRIVFNLGDQELWATTDANGVALASLPLRSVPSTYQVKASFPGSLGLAPSFVTTPFVVNRQTTALAMAPLVVYVKPNVDTKIVAALTDGAANPINERSVLFVVTGANGAIGRAVITDPNGLAPLGPVSLPGGTYSVTAYFNGTIPFPGNTITVDDGRYVPSTTAGILNVTLVVDDLPPKISCPVDIVQSTTSGRCDAVVSFTPTVTDDNPGVSFICNPPSGSVFPPGPTPVTCVATDTAGNTSSCSFLVTVKDTELPMITAPADLLDVPTDKGACSAAKSNVALGAPVTSDNCAVAGVINDAPDPFPKGTTIVTWTVTDTSGNKATASQKVTVQDHELPTITAPADLGDVPTDPGLCSTVKAHVTLGAPVTGDNCGVASVANNAPDSFPKGTTTVTWTVVDTSGNKATATQNVTIQDHELPVIHCPGKIVVGNDLGKASAVVNFSVTASDNCQVASIVSSPASGSPFPLGTTTVTSTATDTAGNKSVCAFTVTVNDTEAPVIKSISASPNILSPPDERFVLVKLTVVATDNAGPVTSVITSVASNEQDSDAEYGGSDWIITGPLTVKLEAERNRKGTGRTYTITVKCSDAAGNSSTGTTSVFVPK